MKKDNTQNEFLSGPATDIQEAEVVETPANGIEVHKEQQLPMATVSIDNIADLDNATVAPIDLMSDYWTPTNPGESKRVIFDRIGITPVLSTNGTGEVIDLECAFFFVKDNGSVKQICNGSKRLVGSLLASNVKYGMALEITYLGKKLNATNSFKSDNWSVKPLVINPKKN